MSTTLLSAVEGHLVIRGFKQDRKRSLGWERCFTGDPEPSQAHEMRAPWERESLLNQGGYPGTWAHCLCAPGHVRMLQLSHSCGVNGQTLGEVHLQRQLTSHIRQQCGIVWSHSEHTCTLPCAYHLAI